MSSDQKLSEPVLNAQPTRFKYFDLILALFAVVLIVSNLASTKTATVNLGFWQPAFDGGTILFPLTYIFGDLLTEVYGYARSRRVIWFGLAMNMLATLTFALVASLPESVDSPTKGAFGVVFAFAPRILLASTLAFFVGEFLNSYVLARLKLLTGGRWLWTRTIGSTLVGQGADTLVFSLVAFWGVLPSDVLWGLVLFNYLYKVGLEVVLTPVTYAVVSFLKRAEGVDVFDRHTNFSPFKWGKSGS
ncbi:VUT family protein [Deinococcus psychrotolerans]|uniref:Probable queuosine precursor transporter n=1 Tax=Deinococcus psychrotolerans TaxID=2489213 RepID=A0A3G8Y8H8_9DEIO|nr:queuosine precursor transporter [Deinococcus psychrotolerans]AZI41679.1 VUT family protein [Deinococcus psychrotolerans]